MKRLAIIPLLAAFVIGGCFSSNSKVPRLEAVAAVQAVGATTGAPDPTVYRIDYGDRLAIGFLYHHELDVQAAVRDFHSVGLTPDELEADISRRASITHRNPVVSVVVREFTIHRAYIGGEVRRPGFVPIRPGLTSLRAVLERGGFQYTARLDSVLHIAWNPDGGYSAQRINIESVLETGDTSQDIALGPNDVVFVPATWVANADLFVKQYVRDLIPVREPVSRLPAIGGE
ncbi:MAG: protein involved in polysaccharide export with SLBB domain [Hyphomicrobiaceae bacterium]|jgi:protein involved in polysaccharide export with SLBB domain